MTAKKTGEAPLAQAAGPATPDQPAQTAAVLAAIDQVCADSTLAESARRVLQQARHALQATQEHADSAFLRYQALFDAVPDPVSIIDEQGTLIDINRASLGAYQRRREDVVGQPLHVLNPDLPRNHMDPVWEMLHRGETHVVCVTNMRADGTRFPVEVHSAGFRHQGRNCVVAVARDLSGRHEAELRYRELMEVIDKGIVMHDADGRIVFANAAAMRIFNVEEGLTLEQELHPSRWQLFDERGQEIGVDELPTARALRSGTIAESRVLGFYNRRLRQLTWLSGTAVPQFAGGSERPHHVLSMFSDVTSLKRDSGLFDRAQALAHIGGWQWDASRNRLYLTEEAQRILGREPAPDTMEVMIDCLVNSDRRHLRQALDQSIADGSGFDMELQGRRGDGHAFWVHAIGQAEAGDPSNARLTGTIQDITHDKQAQATLQVLARTDRLTGLLNREAILQELDERLGDSTQTSLAVLYVDLDRFKIVNDMLGHAAGDLLLASAARRLQHGVGSEGLIARFGGDEFLVVCTTGDDGDRPVRLAEAILQTFSASFSLQGEEFGITASIGIAQSPTHGIGSQQLIQSADVAMYDSKRRGRNSWQMFTAQLDAQEQHRLQLETHMRHAVINGEFRLVYQPQVDLATGRLIAVEALIRWHNPVLGDMPPDRFIGYAESSGDIVKIGSWVLNEACGQLKRWRDSGLMVQRVAVNVSYRQFLGEDLLNCVSTALRDAGLPGSALELEFTERVLIEDEPDTLRTFAALRALGVMLTIDDFGEGYSALNYLRRLPIHGLKLSQLFVQGVPDNRSDVAVCQAVCGIAHSLNLGLVAEGVETEHQRDFLRGLGVTVGQGFLFAPGLPAELLQQRYAIGPGAINA